MKNLINKYICEILFVAAIAFFCLTKDLNNPYDKTIMQEGHGYYAYLPATFIYHDYTFAFFDTVYPKYYAEDLIPPSSGIINEFDGIRVNKYYPGVSLLWLPFFLLAHFAALLFHLPADGYSDIYQYALGLAGLFYLWLGMRFTKKILTHFEIPPSVQSITLLGILFGTNLLLYGAAWSTQPHVYSFFLIAAFSWFIIRLSNPVYANRSFAIGMSFIFLALIFTTRPQNIIILMLLPFFGLNRSGLRSLNRQNIFSFFTVTGMIVALMIVARVCYYWYVQTGKFFLNPYHGEHYYFFKPHMLDILFSYRKGWILYSPFIALGLAGIFFFKKRSQKIQLGIFWILLIYISSCWWCWTYSPSSFGQRTFIDFYCLIALQSATWFHFLCRAKMKSLPYVTTSLLIPLSLLQTHQYRYGIIAGDASSKETYWNNFFVTHPLAFYPIPEKTITNRAEIFQSFDDHLDNRRTTNDFFSGGNSSFVCRAHPFSEDLKTGLPSFLKPDGFSHLRVSAIIKSTPSSAKEENIVIDFKRNNETISYHSYNLGAFIHDRKWSEYQCGVTIPSNVNFNDSVLVYLWKTKEGTEDTTYIDNLKLEFISTDKSYELIH